VLSVGSERWLAAILDHINQYGIASDRVVDYESALARARTQQYDVIVLATVPGDDTAEICHRFRRAGAICPILVTGRDTDATAALNSGADGFLAGPMDGTELVARLRAAQRRFRYELSRRALPQQPLQVSDTNPAGSVIEPSSLSH
jgi:DNA-binding response OmpR family regulator